MEKGGGEQNFKFYDSEEHYSVVYVFVKLLILKFPLVVHVIVLLIQEIVFIWLLESFYVFLPVTWALKSKMWVND